MLGPGHPFDPLSRTTRPALWWVGNRTPPSPPHRLLWSKWVGLPAVWDPTVQGPTAYIIFVLFLHGQDENHGKTDYASKQCKSWWYRQRGAKLLVTWGNFAPHNKQNICCGAKLLFIYSNCHIVLFQNVAGGRTVAGKYRFVWFSFSVESPAPSKSFLQILNSSNQGAPSASFNAMFHCTKHMEPTDPISCTASQFSPNFTWKAVVCYNATSIYSRPREGRGTWLD